MPFSSSYVYILGITGVPVSRKRAQVNGLKGILFTNEEIHIILKLQSSMENKKHSPLLRNHQAAKGNITLLIIESK